MRYALLALLLLSSAAHSAPPVKKSASGRCYDINLSLKYEKIKHFIPYKTLDECIKSGGRQAKGVFV